MPFSTAKPLGVAMFRRASASCLPLLVLFVANQASAEADSVLTVDLASGIISAKSSVSAGTYEVYLVNVIPGAQYSAHTEISQALVIPPPLSGMSTGVATTTTTTVAGVSVTLVDECVSLTDAMHRDLDAATNEKMVATLLEKYEEDLKNAKNCKTGTVT